MSQSRKTIPAKERAPVADDTIMEAYCGEIVSATDQHEAVTQPAKKRKNLPTKSSSASKNMKALSPEEDSDEHHSKGQHKKQRPWTEQEQTLVRSLVQQHGKDWKTVAQKLNAELGRTPNQVRYLSDIVLAQTHSDIA
ncbi:hypothetical protein HDV00_002506 [Rhizophlyctis rosea]|nr:hypothetical protein HDV00_002506 [Rhizophlyctis rosea]